MSSVKGDPSEVQGDGPVKKKVKFSSQVSVQEFHAHPAAETVVFHLLYSTTPAELEQEMASGGQPFKCEFYNQVFGDGEEINGYRGLHVDVWLAAHSFHCWVDVRWEDKQSGADDVLTLLQAWWPQPFATEKADFLQRVAAAPALDFAQMGQQIASMPAAGAAAAAAAGRCGSSSSSSAAAGEVKLYHSKLADTPDWFKDLHTRLQPLLIFTIDGANYIDAADPKWEIVAAVLHAEGKQQQLVGFMTLYNFYAWPLNQRPRVAQVLVLPSLQGGGYVERKAMIKAAYDLAKQREAVDLTFEDPAPGLQRLREKLELDMAAGCPWLTQAADAALAAAEAEEERQQAAARELFTKVQRQQQRQQQEQAGAAQQQQQQQQQQADASTRESLAAAGDGAGLSADARAGAAAGAAEQAGRSPASLLKMPPELQQRVTRELKIHKHQVHALWEALLFLQAPLAADHPLAEPLQEFVMSRLEACHAAMADRHAAHKRLVAVEGKADDWFVYKVPHKARGSSADAGAGLGLMQDTVNVGRHTITEMSADDWGERLQQLTAERMEQLVQLKLKVLAARSKGS
ncbi:hypothetical protein OEZ85_011433 [Tetradesmus obliquus]|uniref:histone acetyltransferase n=1 Tax=Tetradesmus obliquus TaxID=3088 RepID=A0ABY8TQE9_TETOB|nr:hypothetical protein OEZ85_011433 [Tetradesmus obliquus]